MSMVTENWCAKRRKKKGREDNSGRTRGRDKGVNCQATPIERYMATRNRSYKHPQYHRWLEVKPGIKKPTKRMA